MEKSEKLELYRLLEPKFKKKYINGESPTEEDFAKLGLSHDDLEEFMNLYVSKWEHYLFWKDELQRLPKDGLRTPPDSVFYNFGIKNIDLFEFKLIIHGRHPVITIQKSTGSVFASWVKEYAIAGAGFDTADINEFITIEIKTYEEFFKNLEEGKMDSILSVKLFEKRFYNVPQDIELYQAQKVVDLYFLASHLKSENEIFVYEDGMGWWTYEDLSQFVDPNEADLSGYSKNALIFRVMKPLEVRHELINGNLNALSEFKWLKNFYD